MYSDDIFSVREAEACGDAGAPVAPLRPKPPVAEAAHQFGPEVGDAKRMHPSLGRAVGEAIARQRGHDDIERVARVAAVARRVGEQRQDLEHLDERAGPAVGDDQRQRGRACAARVDEMDAQPADGGAKVREGVDGPLLRRPVEALVPVPFVLS